MAGPLDDFLNYAQQQYQTASSGNQPDLTQPEVQRSLSTFIPVGGIQKTLGLLPGPVSNTLPMVVPKALSTMEKIKQFGKGLGTLQGIEKPLGVVGSLFNRVPKETPQPPVTNVASAVAAPTPQPKTLGGTSGGSGMSGSGVKSPLPEYSTYQANPAFANALGEQVSGAEQNVGKAYAPYEQELNNFEQGVARTGGPMAFKLLMGALNAKKGIANEKAQLLSGARTGAYTPAVQAATQAQVLPMAAQQAKLGEIQTQRLAQLNPMLAAQLAVEQAKAPYWQAQGALAQTHAKMAPLQALSGLMKTETVEMPQLKNARDIVEKLGQIMPDSPLVKESIATLIDANRNPQKYMATSRAGVPAMDTSAIIPPYFAQ